MKILQNNCLGGGIFDKKFTKQVRLHLASFPGSTDQLFFAHSKISLFTTCEKKLVSRAWERGYLHGPGNEARCVVDGISAMVAK